MVTLGYGFSLNFYIPVRARDFIEKEVTVLTKITGTRG